MTTQTSSHLRSSSRMSNTGYHQNGQPTWWARVGSGSDAQWIEIPWTRGDRHLDCVVDLPVGTVVHIGAGKGSRKTIRETVTTTAIESAPEAEQVAPHTTPAVDWSTVD